MPLIFKHKRLELRIHTHHNLFAAVLLGKCPHCVLRGHFFVADAQLFNVSVFDKRAVDIQIRLRGILDGKLADRVAVCYFAEIR